MSVSQPILATHSTALGSLYRGDCLDILRQTEPDSVDLIFADPPFNLGKAYASGMDDAIPEQGYLEWCKQWIEGCVRVLKPGGSFFLYNLPKWNLTLGAFITERLTFRHLIAIEMTYTLPISGRLYPSHYSLLYACKGPRPTTFSPDRIAMGTCPHCSRELKDYGGYKDKMNPAGITLSDVWKDIPPVRHPKFKRRSDANELSIKLLDRVITLASRPGDLVLDPFGGSGSTYAVAEIKGRRWLGMELGPVDQIIARLDSRNLEIERGYLEDHRRELNALFPPEVLATREQRGIWTPGNIPKGKPRGGNFSPEADQAELVLQEPLVEYPSTPTTETKPKRPRSRSLAKAKAR